MPKSTGILFCGGGTGGHVLPGLAVAEALRGRGEAAFRWIGDPARIEATLVPRAGITLLPFGLSRPRLYSPRWLLASVRQAWGCFCELRRSPPRVVVALGGYAALLPGLLAPLLGRPLLVMEQNARSGRTNRLLARFAGAVVTQFPEARHGLPAARISQLGNPVRPIAHRPRGRDARLVVLVAGGSLAASTLNDLMLGAAQSLGGIADLAIVHLAGDKDQQRVAARYRELGIDAEVLGFCHDMPALYDRIDIAITRAGATTVAELCAAGIPALYIPLPWAADDHQTANAQAVTRVGGAEVLPQAGTSPEVLAGHLRRLAGDRAAVERMGHAARSLARPHAAAEVAALVQSLDRRQVSQQRAGRKTLARRLARQAVFLGRSAGGSR
jgi:UDP-N-acetylglucosamine--N-acetylmuramyl-(pentapeptide) pyrophosphoryl-undecaprenol N-acetylglucosamine transferase